MLIRKFILTPKPHRGVVVKEAVLFKLGKNVEEKKEITKPTDRLSLKEVAFNAFDRKDPGSLEHLVKVFGREKFINFFREWEQEKKTKPQNPVNKIPVETE